MKPAGEAKEWIYKAEEDFLTASVLVKKRRRSAPDNICFCAQQCAEKYLKAFLVHHRITFPKTHDLLVLEKLAEERESLLSVLRPSLGELVPYSVAYRYPGSTASMAEAKEALGHAKVVRRFFREYFSLPLR